MKKPLVILSLLTLLTAGAHAVSFDIDVQEIPVMVFGMDSLNNTFGTFMNIATATAKFNINDSIGFQFRVKDTYIHLTNETRTNRNQISIDRANFFFNANKISILAGRSLFIDGDGLLVGGIADGLMVKTGFLNMTERFFVLYSGFLPDDVNPFDANTFDALNGAERLMAGLSVQKMGLLIKSVALKYFYTMDLSTNANNTNTLYSPMYAAFEFSGMIKNFIGYGGNFVYAFGGGAAPISAFAFDVKAYIQLKALANTSVSVRYSYASGNADGGANESFKSFGYYDTGFVLNPEFCNLSMIKAGVTTRLWGGRVFLNANYYYLSLLNDFDRVDNFYDGTGTKAGSEVSGSLNIRLDANIVVFVNAGIFLKNDAFSTNANVHKVVTGVQLIF